MGRHYISQILRQCIGKSGDRRGVAREALLLGEDQPQPPKPRMYMAWGGKNQQQQQRLGYDILNQKHVDKRENRVTG